MPECERPFYGRGYCRAHHARWKRHGDPRAAVPIQDRTSSGQGYSAALQRIHAARGPATGQSCAECGAPAALWSYDGTDPDERTHPARGCRYSPDPGRYRPSCRSCHHRAATRPRRAVALDVERAARLYRAGANSRGIGALLQASPSAVRAALRTHGVALRPGIRQRR